jgi:hypothetical protein
MIQIYSKEFIKSKKEEFDNAQSDIQSQMEFEIRISENDCGSAVKSSFFTYLQEECNVRYKNAVQSESQVIIYQKIEGKKTLQYREINSKDGKDKICQEKTKPEPRDLYYRGETSDYCFRMSFSHENPIDCPPSDKGNILFTRKRKRVEFDTGKGYVYVFTDVDETKTGQKVTKKYEVEIEFDIKKLSVELIQESLTELMGKHLLSNIPKQYEELAMEKFNENMKGFKPVKPINLNDTKKTAKKHDECPVSKYDIYEIFSRKGYPYQVTNKLDGERCFLFFNNNQVFSIGKSVNFVCMIDQTKKDLKKDTPIISIADVEYFNGKYYFFDCYVFENKPVYLYRLTERLEWASELSEKNHTLFEMKTFSPLLSKETRNLLTTLDRTQNDGIIYTPEDPSRNLPIYKWKFPEKMSIDFQVKKIKSGTYHLLVSSKKGLKLFEIDGKSATFSTSEEVKDNEIYEFMYDKNFILHRHRPDKTSPNYICTALDVWNDIVTPFTEEKLKKLFEPLHFYRKYHNQIKRSLISQFCKAKKVLDLGVGKGGDLPKYKDSNVKAVIGVEPYSTNFKDLKNRIKENRDGKMDIDFTLVETAAQDTDVINEKVGVEGVDIVTSFFSLSFFFFPKRPQDLVNLAQTISQNLKEGGYFIGTTIDGDRTKELLTPMPNKTFDFDDGFIKINDDNTVTFEVKDTIVETQQESLVDFNRLKSELEKVGLVEQYEICSICKGNHDTVHDCKFVLVDIDTINNPVLPFFDKSSNLTQNENMLNSLYRTFIFKKREISAEIDALCKENTFANLLTKSNRNDCDGIFEKIKLHNGCIDTVIPRKDIYNALQQFYFYKKHIDVFSSDQFVKWYSIYGTRTNKKSIVEYLPPNKLVLLQNYAEANDFPVLREQFIAALEKLHSQSIRYTNFKNGLCVYKDETGAIRLLFTDYNAFVIDNEYKGYEDEIQHLLELLKPK